LPAGAALFFLALPPLAAAVLPFADAFIPLLLPRNAPLFSVL
jgi:hypothetical protein